MFVMSSEKIKTLFKGLLGFLNFSHINVRGANKVYSKKEGSYLNYLMFNEEVYNAETEISLRIWH